MPLPDHILVYHEKYNKEYVYECTIWQNQDWSEDKHVLLQFVYVILEVKVVTYYVFKYIYCEDNKSDSHYNEVR